MKSSQFWLRLLPLIGLLNYFCACFHMYASDLIKVPRGNHQDTGPRYYPEKSENDVINQLDEISSEEDVFAETPEYKGATEQNGNNEGTAVSLLGNQTVTPDQNEMDEVDEEVIRDGNREIDVNKDNEFVTEIVEDTDTKTPVLLPLTTSTTKVDYRQGPENDEKLKWENSTSQIAFATATVTDRKAKGEHDNGALSFGHAQSETGPLKTKYPGLNTSSSKTSPSKETINVNTVSQTLSSRNSSSLETKHTAYQPSISSSIRENAEEKQELVEGSVVKPAEKVQSGNNLFSGMNDDDASKVNSSSKISLLDRVFTKMGNHSNTTNSIISFTKTPYENHKTLIQKLHNKFYDDQNDEELKKGPLAETQVNGNRTGLSDASTVGNGPKETLGTRLVGLSSKTILGVAENQNEKHKLLIKGLDSKFDSIRMNTSEQKTSFAANPQSHLLPRINSDKPKDTMDRITLPNGLSDNFTKNVHNVNRMIAKVQNNNLQPISKFHVVSRLQNFSSVKETESLGDWEEEREMETYGLHHLKGSLGVHSPNKRAGKFRRTDILNNNSLNRTHLSKNSSTPGRHNAVQRLQNFLKKVKEMFTAPETPEDVMGWEKWSSCSRTCGKMAFRTRNRKCARLIQSDFDVACPEPRVETQKCENVSCSGESRKEKLKEFLKMSGEDDAKKPKQRPSVNNDQRMIDQMFATELDRPKVFLDASATEKPKETDDDELAQDEDTSDSNSEYEDEEELNDSNSSENSVASSNNLENVQSVARGQRRYLYTVWGSWSACTRTCGQRSYAFRKRYCINAVNGEVKRHCQRPTILAKRCLVNPCPVNGGLSPWSEWSSCSDVCGIMERHRSCTNPKPAYGGKECRKLPVQMRMCGSCKEEQMTTVQKLASYSPRFLCGFDPCKRVGCLENKDAICVTDFECNPTFFDNEGAVLRRCNDNANLFLRPLAQKKCSFNPCAFTKCDITETKCLVDTKCRPFFVNSVGKKVDCKGSNILQVSSDLICGFNPCKITTCTIDPEAKCVTDYRCEPIFINSAGKRISGCTEDEATEAERLNTETTSSNEKEVRDQTPLEKRVLFDLQDRFKKYQDKPSIKKSTEGKIDKEKTKLQTIELLESILKKRLNTNKESSKNLNYKSGKHVKIDSRKDDHASSHKASDRLTGIALPTKKHDGLTPTYLNSAGKSLVTTIVHRNDSETTEVVQQISSLKGTEVSSHKNPEKIPLLGNVSHVDISHALKFSQNPVHSKTSKNEIGYIGNYSNTSLVSSIPRDNKLGKIKVENSLTNSSASLGVDGSDLDSGEVTSVTKNSSLSMLKDQQNKSSSVNTTVHYQVGVPQWTFMHSKGPVSKDGDAAFGNSLQGDETGSETSRLPLNTSLDVDDGKSDDPYVYPWENYLADLTNDNAEPVSYDDTTNGTASGQSVVPLDFNNVDGNFQNFKYNSDEPRESEQLENGTFILGDQSEPPKTLDYSNSAGVTVEKTGKEEKEGETDLNFADNLIAQIPWNDVNEANRALSKISNEESDGIPSKEDLEEVPAPVEASKVAQKPAADDANISAQLRHGKPARLDDESKLNRKPKPEIKSSPREKGQQLEPHVTTKDQKSKLINDVLMKALDDELSKLRLQGLLDYQLTNLGENEKEDQGSEGISRGKEDPLNHDKNIPSFPVLNDDKEQGRTDEYGDSSLKVIDDFLKKDNSGLGHLDGQLESKVNENKEMSWDAFHNNEATVESPDNYKVSLVPGKSEEDTEFGVNESENGIGEDSGRDIQRARVRLREPEFKETYSPALAGEIKELGLNEYYIKDGFESQNQKHHKVEDGELYHIISSSKPRFSRLRKGERAEDYVEGRLPLRFVRYRKTYGLRTHPLIAPDEQALLRQHNLYGDEIERQPSSYREDDATERSRTLGKTTESLEQPSYLKDDHDFQGKNDDSHVGSLANYLDNVKHYINRVDGALLSSKTRAKHRDEANEEKEMENALAFNANNDHEISHSRGEDTESLRTLEHAYQKDDMDKDPTSDNGNEWDREGLITFRATDDHQGTLEDKKSKVDNSPPNFKHL